MRTVAAIIPTYNRLEPLRGVLHCLGCQKMPEATKLIVVVVVDGSIDGTTDMLKSEFPEVEMVAGSGSWWYTRCINEGLKRGEQLGADFFITLNDDVVFGKNYLRVFLNMFEGPTEKKIVGSASFTQSKPAKITFSGVKKVFRLTLKEISWFPKYSLMEPEQVSGFRNSVNLSGRGMFFSASILRYLGYFDERMPQYGSDTDFSYRAHKAGYEVLVSYDAWIVENERLTSKGSLHNKVGLREYVFSWFNRYSVNSLHKASLFYWKHGYRLLLPVYMVYVLFASFFIFFYKYRRI